MAAPGPAVAGQQGVVPPAPPAPVAPTGPLQPYRALYNNHALCPFKGAYTSIYDEWKTPDVGQPPNTPGELRGKLYSNTTSIQAKQMAHVLLVRPTTAGADDPGLIQGYHRLSKYVPMIGETTPFDNSGYSFLGDVYEGNAPATVIFEDTYFNRVTSTRVKTSAAIDQYFAANPNEQLMGPYDAADADTETVTTRVAMFIPNKYVTMIMEQGLSPRDAWLRVKAAITLAGDEAALEPLINWFRVALTRPLANTLPRQSVVPPASQLLPGGLDASRFNAFRQSIIRQDLLQLNQQAVTAGANQIAQGLNQLVTEQRQARIDDETRRLRDKNKTPLDLYGEGGILKLLRWCGVADQGSLPPIHKALANAGRGKSGGMTHRRALQLAVDTEAEVLGLTDLDLQITPSVATRVVNLAWASSTPNNLGVGLHPFAVGYMSEEAVELQRLVNEEADLLYSGDAAPSLQDAQSVVSADKDVHIPKSLVQARITLQRAHLLFAVLLGDNHRLVRHYQDYIDRFQRLETRLEATKPRNHRHHRIVPALLVRRVQLETNEWLREQAVMPGALPTIDMMAVFREISLCRDWAPDFPEIYLQVADPLSGNTAPRTVVTEITAPSTASISTITASAAGGGGTRLSASNATPAGSTPTSQPKSNPSFNSSLFEPFRSKNLVTKRVKAYCQANNVALPVNRDDKVMCLAWHLKGHCNEGCGSRLDHRVHDTAEDSTLLAWAQSHYRTS